MNKSQRIGWVVISCSLLILVLFIIRLSPSRTTTSSAGSKDYAHSVSFIELGGIIMSQTPGGFGSQAVITPSGVKELLDKAVLDATPLLVLSVNSPGGSVGPTQEIYDHLRQFKKETGKPIYVWMRDVAASGGYYIACPADKIIAMPSTITGSIGVILQLINYEELLNKIGVKEHNLKSGKFKDMGSPGKPLDSEVETMLQELVDEQFELFFQTVLQHRNLREDDLRKHAQGQIFTAYQAKAHGLVDEVKGWYELKELIKEDMGWTEDFRWVQHRTKTNWWSWLEGRLPVSDFNLWKIIQQHSDF
jgi:protease IV